MKKVLITGGYGFIGSHTVDLFLKNDFHVTVVDNLTTGRVENLHHLKPYQNPLLLACKDEFDSFRILSEIRSGKFDYVLHFAANASVPYSVERPVETNQINLTKTISLLDACRVGKVKKFVFSSSSAVYGNCAKFPTNELEEIHPLSPYALQKSLVEQYCKLFYQLYGLESISLRYFNVFGPRQAGSGPYANVVSSWCEQGIRNNKIRLDGEGKAYRDFIHVSDVAKANLLAVISDIKFGCYNVGSGVSVQISELLRYFKTYFGNIEVINAPTRKGDPERTQADIRLIQKDFGFSPLVVTEDMFYNTFKWYKENIK